MTQLYVLLFLLVVQPNDLDGAACHDGWSNYTMDNKCYKLFSAKKSWNEAKTACDQVQAKLAELKNSNTNDFVQATFIETAWVGAHRCGGGVTCFLNNDYVPYTPYASDEPDMKSDQKSSNQKATDLKENDFAILIQTDGRWADELKNNTYPYICEMPEVNILDSVILESEPKEFTDKLGLWLPKTGNWSACWRGSRDGWDVRKTFHPNCDGKIPTLTIVKARQNNTDYIFGGYATKTWAGSKSVSAPGSFLFSLRNNDNIPPFKAPLKNQNDVEAIIRADHLGPIFGGGRDLFIENYANTNTLSFTKFGHSYQAPPGYSYGSTNTKSLLAGSETFTPSEVEVLYLQDFRRLPRLNFITRS